MRAQIADRDQVCFVLIGPILWMQEIMRLRTQLSEPHRHVQYLPALQMRYVPTPRNQAFTGPYLLNLDELTGQKRSALISRPGVTVDDMASYETLETNGQMNTHYELSKVIVCFILDGSEKCMYQNFLIDKCL